MTEVVLRVDCAECGRKCRMGFDGVRRGERVLCDECAHVVRDQAGFAWLVEEVDLVECESGSVAHG